MKNRLSKLEATALANSFWNKLQSEFRGKECNFEAISCEKSVLPLGYWKVCYDMVSIEGNIMDGPIVLFVDANGNVIFSNELDR